MKNKEYPKHSDFLNDHKSRDAPGSPHIPSAVFLDTSALINCIRKLPTGMTADIARSSGPSNEMQIFMCRDHNSIFNCKSALRMGYDRGTNRSEYVSSRRNIRILSSHRYRPDREINFPKHRERKPKSSVESQRGNLWLRKCVRAGPT